MKITYKGDYALKAILDLSERFDAGNVVPLSDISKRQNIPVQYLEQIMLTLKGAGIVESKRGKGGGFILSIPPEQLTLGDVVRLIEGPVEPIVCGKRNHDSSCGEEEFCAFREIWVKVNDAITEIVDHVTFDHIVKRSRELRAENAGYMYEI